MLAAWCLGLLYTGLSFSCYTNTAWWWGEHDGTLVVISQGPLKHLCKGSHKWMELTYFTMCCNGVECISGVLVVQYVVHYSEM